MMGPITRLTVLAACCGLMLATVYAMTREDIEANRKAFARRQLLAVVDDDQARLIRIGDDLYAVEKDDRRRGYVFETTTDQGYNGRIALWLGVDPDGRITGVRVKSHQETPGIGDKIEVAVSDWIESFTGKSLGDPGIDRWKVKRDGGAFDQFTGATITPRAVVGAVKQGLERARAHSDDWQQRGGSAQ